MRSFRRRFAGAALLGLLLPIQMHAQEVKAGSPVSVTVRGILSASFFAQDALFGLGNGQKAQYVQEDFTDDEWWHGGDARSMRLTLGITAPDVIGDWRANGTFEMDFFGPFASGGNFGDEQPLPRLRLAYAGAASVQIQGYGGRTRVTLSLPAGRDPGGPT